ncbi:peptidoglycan-associated lipoprotein Pal [Jeongeupia chitinilytica]|uniref:Peptidoglycan-associated lipoprotein n=1 Tax=Jeongeupia chitinilytica TaxID=1041641 RepID=A0ABQ3H512_9NEIS|nr:peptidoglycan-associated lipoprotein Pal [Jeongeupia chitinilytica]GHD65007.1 peptidoglycan-associated lipoprotein [Jeongeupia chitinilytica]
MKKVALSVLMTALLAACSSTPPADPNAGKTTAPVTGSETKPATVDLTQGSDLNKGNNPLTDPNNILSQRRVYFDFDSFVVKSDYQALLAAHAKYLLANKDAKLIVQGNTDDRGTAEYNLALGQKRAEATKKVLLSLGVPESQLESVSFGEEKPLEPGQTEEAWSRNRNANLVYKGESAQ